MAYLTRNKGEREEQADGEEQSLVLPHTKSPYKGIKVASVDTARHGCTLERAGHQNC